MFIELIESGADKLFQTTWDGGGFVEDVIDLSANAVDVATVKAHMESLDDRSFTVLDAKNYRLQLVAVGELTGKEDIGTTVVKSYDTIEETDHTGIIDELPSGVVTALTNLENLIP